MTQKDLKSLLREKKICRKNLRDEEKIRDFYQKIKGLSLNEMEEFFPAPEESIAQNLFDYTNEILCESTLNKAIDISLSMFDPETIEKCSDGSFQNDMKLLQSMFFFLIEEIFRGEKGAAALFKSAISEGTWMEAETQSAILNRIASGMGFIQNSPFDSLDFCSLGGKHFRANESVLRIFYNFMHPALYAKEGIVNELNFIREQQKNILPIFPNTRKMNYTKSDANKEIEEKAENLKILRSMDFGFFDSDYTQSFFACDEEFRESFTRPITCKCFQETNLVWENEPHFNLSGRRKIVAKKSDRAINKSALMNKFLYSERNMITHVSENFAVFRLFSKEYTKYEMVFWEELLLESMYDVHTYILGMSSDGARKKLLAILNHYFEKITDRLGMEKILVEQRWECVFGAQGDCNLEKEDLKKTNIFNILSDDEVTHFKRFMAFMYCSENGDSDFFERNRKRIQLYLIYLSLRLSSMDFQSMDLITF